MHRGCHTQMSGRNQLKDGGLKKSCRRGNSLGSLQ